MTLSVKPDRAHQREGRDDRGRDRDRGDERRAQVAQEEEHDERRQERAEDQVLLHRVGRGLDVGRLVAHDLHPVARRQPLLDLLQPLLHPVDDRDGVRAALLADVQEHGRLPVP